MANLTRMSVYDALERRKIYSKRLDSLLDNPTISSKFAVGVCPAMVNDFKKDSEKMSEDIKSSFDSIMALMQNIATIDAAISEYNAQTKITVADKTYSIAAAISREKRIVDEIRFYTDCLDSFNDIKRSIQANNERINSPEAFADFIKKTTPEKTKESSADMVSNLTKQYKEMYTYTLVDPMNLGEKLPKLIEEAELFKSQFHSKIVHSNYVNELELELA